MLRPHISTRVFPFLLLTVGGVAFAQAPPTISFTHGDAVFSSSQRTVSVDPMALGLDLGTSANVTARIDPVPVTPIRIVLQAAKNGIVSMPDVLITDADGRAVIPVRAIGAGSTTVSIALLDVDGGASAILGVTVTLGMVPFATSIMPAVGRESGGETVRLHGFNFSSNCALSFGGVPVPQAYTWLPPEDTTILQVVTPPHDPGVVDIEVRCGTRSSVFAYAFTYQPAPVKSVHLFTKSGTTRGGTLVYIEGVDLRYQSCTVRLGQIPLELISSHDTTNITAVTPAHDAGIMDVSLVCGSEVVTLPNAFSYVTTDDPPASQSLFWYSQLQQGETAEVIATGLRPDDEVLINGVPVPDMTTTELNYHLYTVPDIVGQAELTLRDYLGRSITRTVTIYPKAATAITSMPDRVALGAEFSVVSTGLLPGLTYMIGPAPVPVVRNSKFSYSEHDRYSWGIFLPAVFRAPISVGPGTFSFTVADHGTVVVTKPIELTTSGLVVSSVMPPCAVYDGGSLVTISGSGFEEGAAVRFFTTYSPQVVVKDPFTIIAKVPPSYGTLPPQITVVNPDGTSATLTNAFTFTASGAAGCGGGRHRASGH